MLPCFGVILHTVGGGDQPALTDDGRSAHVAETFDMEADLPGKLPCIGVLTAHNTRRLKHSAPAVCNVKQSINHRAGVLRLVVVSEVGGSSHLCCHAS